MKYCNQEFDDQVMHAAQRALRRSLDLGSDVWHADYRARFERFGDYYVRPLVASAGASARLAAVYVTCVDTNWRVIPTLRLLEAVAALDADAVARVLDIDAPIPRSMITRETQGLVFVRNPRGAITLERADAVFAGADGRDFSTRADWNHALGGYVVDASKGPR